MRRSKKAKGDWDRRVGTHRKLEGAEFVTDVVLVDQAPIGRTPRSNPVTYLKAFDPIRELFAATKDARVARPHRQPLLLQRAGRPLRGVRGRRRGQGRDAVPRRRLRAVRAVRGQALQAAGARGEVPRPRRRPGARHDRPRGADVLQQRRRRCCAGSRCSTRSASATSGSASRRRRCRAARRSGSRSPRTCRRTPATACSTSSTSRRPGCTSTTSRSCWPRSGSCCRPGHSLLVIEHNLDVIKTADWIVDLGPEGGEEGGHLVAVGTPEQIAQVEASHTGRYLRDVLAVGRSNVYGTART